MRKILDERLFDIQSLAKEIQWRIRYLEKKLTPEVLEWRRKIWGDEKISIVATVAHQNLSIPSVYLVGWERFRQIVEMLNIEKAIWLIINDETTVKNEKYKKGGGEILEFGPFGKFKSLKELKENEEKVYQNIYGVVFKTLKEGTGKYYFSRRICHYITESLLGRIKGVAQLDYGIIEFLLGKTERIKCVYLLDLLKKINMTIEEWRQSRIEFHKRTMVVHYGNIYQEELQNTPWFIPERVNSQTLLYWNWKDKKWDVTTMHLLYFSLQEYLRLIKERAIKLLPPSKVPVRQIEEIIYRYL